MVKVFVAFVRQLFCINQITTPECSSGSLVSGIGSNARSARGRRQHEQNQLEAFWPVRAPALTHRHSGRPYFRFREFYREMRGDPKFDAESAEANNAEADNEGSS